MMSINISIPVPHAPVVANRTREIRLSGMKRGAYGNVSVMSSKD